MRRQHGLRNLVMICGLFSSSVHAADPVPFATRFTPNHSASATPQTGTTPTGTPRQPDGASQPAAPSFADRMQSAQRVQQQQKQAEDHRPKPTNWQIQNPSNPTNNLPTVMTGTIAPNNYFGAQFHAWNNMTQPAPMAQLPFNQTAVPAINQTNLYTAPNNYFGNQFSAWNNLHGGRAEPNAFGSWNYR